MKYISKNIKNEPKEVIEKRNTPGSSFDDLPKEPLRKALLEEQGYICAYCMQRIKHSGKLTKIEHWSPRNDENEKDYMNLLATCKGNEGRDIKEAHCDTLKKNTLITISPLKTNCEKLVKFNTGGEVYSENEIIEKELNEILGLNLQHLVDERIRLIDRVKKIIENESKNNPDKKAKKSLLANKLKEWQTPIRGKYEPFCQVAITYLQKKIARLR